MKRSASSAAFDAEGFLAVQSKDLVRVALDSREIYGFERYSTEIREGFRHARERGIVRMSEARFLERTASGDSPTRPRTSGPGSAGGGTITETDFRSAAPMRASGR